MSQLQLNARDFCIDDSVNSDESAQNLKSTRSRSYRLILRFLASFVVAWF